MEGFLFGFELETVSPFDKRLLCSVLNRKGVTTVVSEDLPCDKRDDYLVDGSYSLVNDSSINPKGTSFGVEIRSCIFALHCLDMHKPLFDALKYVGVMTNARCGLHIHVSHPTHPINSNKLVEMSKHESVRVGRKRKTYTVWQGHESSHYRAVNQRKPNHVEFRWFNGAVDFRYVCQMVRLVNNYCKAVVVDDAVLKNPHLAVPG